MSHNYKESDTKEKKPSKRKARVKSHFVQPEPLQENQHVTDVVQAMAASISDADVRRVLSVQKKSLKSFQKTNERLGQFNDFSSSKYDALQHMFMQHTRLLTDLRNDLTQVFLRVRQLKAKLQIQYPDAFEATFNLRQDLENRQEQETPKIPTYVSGEKMKNSIDVEKECSSTSLSDEDMLVQLEKQGRAESCATLDNHDEVENHVEVENCTEVDNYDEIESHAEVENHTEVDNHDEVENHTEVDNHNEIESHDEVESHAEVENRTEVKNSTEVDNHNEIESHDEVENRTEVKKCTEVDNHDEIESHDEVEVDKHAEGENSAKVEIHAEVGILISDANSRFAVETNSNSSFDGSENVSDENCDRNDHKRILPENRNFASVDEEVSSDCVEFVESEDHGKSIETYGNIEEDEEFVIISND